MKKFFISLVISISIFLIPKAVFASDNSTLQVNFYPLSYSNYETLFVWLNDTSNDYIDSLISPYNYHVMWVESITTQGQNVRKYVIKLRCSNTILDFRNSVSGSSAYFGFLYNQLSPTYYNFSATFNIYKDINSNDWYSSDTFNSSTKITDIGLNDDIKLSNTYPNGEVMSTINIYQGSNSQNFTNAIYTSNAKLKSNASRNILFYNNDMLEDLISISQGDIVPGYREIFFDRPSYLSSYTKITLSTGKQYLAISGINKGVIYVPAESYASYNPFLMYYQNGLEYQPYTNIITDTSLTSDMQYVMITFDFSNLSNIDLVMFSKYDYIEGVDDISYDIFVPNNSFTDEVIVSPNNLGGNNFSFNYKDLEGNSHNENFSVIDEDFIKKNELFNAMFENFSKNFFGLNSIISRPLDLLVNITNSSCEDLVLELPYVNRAITLPCMESIYTTYFGGFFTIYQYLVSGFISYWILIEFVRLVKALKDPNNDKIEVLKL